MLSPSAIQEAALYLDRARLDGRETARLTERHPELSLDEAYAIHDAGIALRTGRGERVVGLKMGLTSRAKREQMNLGAPIYGTLTDVMRVKDGGEYRLAGQIHPKIEPEVAFLVARDVRGVPSFDEALDACSGVCAAMEILDSRYVGFKYFSLPDVVADNSSSSQFVLSDRVLPARSVDLAKLELVMSVNSTVSQRAAATEISGHPVNSIVQLCEILTSRGRFLPAGSIVLAGAATVAVQLEPGMRVELDAGALGRVSVSVAGG